MSLRSASTAQRAVLVLGSLVAMLAGNERTAQAQEPLTERPNLVVRSVAADGGRMSFSKQGDQLAFDAPDRDRGDGLFDIYVLSDPLAGAGERRARCLTCTAPDLRKQHSISPAFHPSGEMVIFQTVGLAQKTKFGPEALNTPQRSNRSEIWLARVDGKDFWKLTDYQAIAGAILDPAFSQEGQRVLWAERTRAKRDGFGSWRLRSGAIRRKRGVPVLSGLKTEYAPESSALIVPHGFTLDDRGALVSANLEEGQSTRGIDLYEIRDKAATRLTKTGGVAEENATFHPSGASITFSSSQTLRRAETADGQGVREIWTMAIDGSDQTRLTFFNEPPADEYRGATYVGDLDWHPDGEWLAAQLVYGRSPKRELVLLQWRAAP